MLEPTHIFAGDPLDRADHQRRDAAWIAARATRPDSRYLALCELAVPLSVEPAPALAWLGPEALEFAAEGAEPVLLGTRDDIACFGLDCSGARERLPFAAGVAFDDARSVATAIPLHESGLLAHARSLVDWHARHRFCAQCGASTAPARGGKERVCEVCGAHHYPRTDPVVIMLVASGDRCLLGRSSRRATGFYSALAGFVDQGESIEEAVRREVREEAGIRVGAVHYHSSQPWPFPSSLMIGCLAVALDDTIRMDEEELADVAWFERARVRAALEHAGEPGEGLRVPGRIAIAHHLIRSWVEDGIPGAGPA